MSIYDQFYIIKNNRIKLLSVVSAGVIILEGATIIDGTGALPNLTLL
jgi:hypothetical protein